MKLRRSYSPSSRALNRRAAIALGALLGMAVVGSGASAGAHAAAGAAHNSRSALQAASTSEALPGVDDRSGVDPASFVSLTMPEGVMVGETLVAEVACSRPLTIDDGAWMTFRPTGLDTTVPVVTSEHITLTDTGFTVTLPIPSDFKIGAFQAFAGCAGPPPAVSGSTPSTDTSAAGWIMIRPNKEYPKFVSVTPMTAELGTDVTFTVTCSMPPGNAGLIVDFESEVKLVEVNTPGAYTVDGSTFSVTTKVPLDAPVGAYSMMVDCDGPSSSFDYFPPPESHSEVLTFSVLTANSLLTSTLPSAL